MLKNAYLLHLCLKDKLAITQFLSQLFSLCQNFIYIVPWMLLWKLIWNSLDLRKNTCLIVWGVSQIRFFFFFKVYHFFLERMTYKQWFPQSWMFGRYFPKKNEMSLSLEDKNSSCQVKIRLLENLYLILWAWQLPNI